MPCLFVWLMSGHMVENHDKSVHHNEAHLGITYVTLPLCVLGVGCCDVVIFKKSNHESA